MHGADCQNRIQEEVSGNIFIRKMLFPTRGDYTEGHAHHFDHTTYVVRGSVWCMAVTPAGEKTYEVIAAGQHRLIRAESHHLFVTLEDDTEYHCIYSHRNAQGEVVQLPNGVDPETAYK